MIICQFKIILIKVKNNTLSAFCIFEIFKIKSMREKTKVEGSEPDPQLVPCWFIYLPLEESDRMGQVFHGTKNGGK